MRRSHASALLLAGLLGIGLVSCSSTGEAPAASPQQTASQRTDAADQTTEQPADEDPRSETEAGDAGADADELCAAESVADEDDVCVLEGAVSTADLSFADFTVVKLIGGSFEGIVSIGGSVRQVVVTDSTFASDLTLDASGGAVVKQSQIGGTLNMAGGHGATIAENTIAGDLLCADGVQANGGGNTVAGEVTGTCARVR